MKFFSPAQQASRALMLLVACVMTCMGGQASADELAKLSQVQGGVMVKQKDGTPRIQGTGSALAVGDTVTTPNNAFARIRIFDNADITLRPGTQVSIEQLATTPANSGSPMAVLHLKKGGINVDATAEQNGRKTSILLRTAFGDLTMQGANAFVAVMEESAEARLAARQAYLFSSTASLDMPGLTGVWTDSPTSIMPSILFAQNTPTPPSGGLTPGLYVSVIDGAINLSNKGGTQNFSAGQFGYTASTTKAPVVVPNNPGLKFTPPATFTANNSTSKSSGTAKAVDCEVR